MGDVVDIREAATRRDGDVHKAWDAYIAARAKAEASNDIADGIAAGRAWARFLSLFTRGAA
jgi:hypothetical protein